MGDEAAFVARLLADPADDAARLVFADWLADRADPRADWVRDPDLCPFALGGGELRDPLPGLLAELGSTRRRGRVTRGLAALGARAVPGLADAAADLGADAPEHAAEVLGHLRAVLAGQRGEFVARLRSGDPAGRVAAAQALRFAPGDAAAAVPALIDMLGGGHDERLAAARALGALGGAAAPAVPALIAAWDAN